jgi:hypothetical protein
MWGIIRTHLDDVKHCRKLREEQYFMAPSKELNEKSIEHHHLPAGVHQFFIQYWLTSIWIRRPVEEERMRADFAQLHDRILKPHVVDLLHCVPGQVTDRLQARGNSQIVFCL